MTELTRLSEIRSAFPDGLERLYRVELEHWEPADPTPAASASEASQAANGFARFAQDATPVRTSTCDCGAGPRPPAQHASWCSALKAAPLVAVQEVSDEEQGRWQRVFIISESENRAGDEIANEILSFIADDIGKWRIRFFYWKGNMHNDYYHVDRKRGDTVEETACIVIDTRDKT